MLVEVLGNIFIEDSNIELLDRLYFEFIRKHKFYVRTDEDIEQIMESNWYNNLSNSRKLEIRDWIINSINIASPFPKCIISNTLDNNFFGLEEAIKYLEQPFKIIIENKLNDRYFFEAIVACFKSQTKNIRHFKKERWLQYENGGGSTIQQVIEAEKLSFSDEIFTKNTSNYLRYFVLIDSDKKHPETNLSNAKSDLICFLNQNNVPYHLFEKREMENYMPDDLFTEILDNQEFINAYLDLEPLQKDFFDIENGFDDKQFEDLDENTKSLFHNISKENYKILRKNNLKKINGEIENFKKDFPKLFLSDKVNMTNLLKRCEHHFESNENKPFDKRELPNLLKRIDNLL